MIQTAVEIAIVLAAAIFLTSMLFALVTTSRPPIRLRRWA